EGTDRAGESALRHDDDARRGALRRMGRGQGPRVPRRSQDEPGPHCQLQRRGEATRHCRRGGVRTLRYRRCRGSPPRRSSRRSGVSGPGRSWHAGDAHRRGADEGSPSGRGARAGGLARVGGGGQANGGARCAHVTACALFLGMPLGMLFGRADIPGKRAALLLHALPAFLPPFLLALGWFYLPHPDALFTSAGAIGVETIAFTPIVTALVALAVQAIDPSMEEAGPLSASPWEVAVRIALPVPW